MMAGIGFAAVSTFASLDCADQGWDGAGFALLAYAPASSVCIVAGAFAGFQDVAIGLTGPVLGVVAAVGRPSSVFLVGAVVALVGAFLSLRLGERNDGKRRTATLQK